MLKYNESYGISFLTIEALDRIRKDMELLIEDNLIEWQGSLKDTYNKYIHPDVLDLDDKTMWNSLCNGEILDAFQYDSQQGRNAISKINPRNFNELMDGNALMRLTCEGIQPIDKYVMHKENIDIWINEMIFAGLTEDEIEVLKEHLLKSYGVAATQESAMLLSMDERISGFDLTQANKLRKAIAKAKAKHMIQEIYNLFIDQGVSLGNRKQFLEFTWESFIVPMLGYSFSLPHIAGYTLILIQEMNLFKLSPLHWKVSCLCVNAGDINDNVERATDYGAIAKAIGNMEKGFIIPPDINKSKLGFKPELSKGKSLYGLGAINGISNDLAREIINLRPFTSLEDFFERCIDTKIVQTSKMYNLIKSGCFDEMNSDRVSVMVSFINHIVPNKEKLTTANLPKLIEYGVIPNELQLNILIQQFKKLTFEKENCVKMINKTQGIFRIPFNLIEFFKKHIEEFFIDAILFDDNGHLCLSSKEFDKAFKNIQQPLMDWIKSKDALDRFNYCSKNEVWMKYCTGSKAKWEMDSICYYSGEHELDEICIDKYYSIENFFELPTTPIMLIKENEKTGRMFRQNKLSIIAGTVVEKNKTKSIITLNTQYGVVEVKLHKDTFVHFDRKVDDDKSWFTRGTKLIIIGYRRGGFFIPKLNRDSMFKSNIMKIDISNDNRINITGERKFEKDYSDYVCFI